MRRTGLLVALAVTVLTLLMTGCGGGSDKKANQAYASSVCSAVASWEQQIRIIATNFNSNLSTASLRAKVAEAESATKSLLAQVKGTPAPNSSQGKAASQQLDRLAGELAKTVDAAKSAISRLPHNASPSTIAAAVGSLAPHVQSLAGASNATFNSLKSGSGSLARAFQRANSCKTLG